MRIARVHPVAAVLAVLLCAAPARSAEVVVQMSARETWVGVPVVLRVIVENGEPQEPPTAPPVDGATIRPAGGPGRSSQTTIVNGRVSQQSSVSYDYQIVPQKPGKLTIPPFEVQVEGRALKTRPEILIVSASESQDLLMLDVQGDRPSVYVGEPIDLTLRIWLKPYRDRQFQFTFTEDHMWGQVDVSASEWGVFEEALREFLGRRQRPASRSEIRQDAAGNEGAYYLYTLRQALWPQRPGRLDVGRINIVVSYPTALRRGRSLFDAGSLAIAAARPVSAQLQSAPIEVKPVPTQGRPAIWRGAVGQYEISATAKPAEVAVGDPITLTLAITGTGQLDQLQPPPLPDLEDLTRDFKVPADPLAGEVEGRTKRFTQSLRARSDAVRQIPPIPFAYFDPRQEKFVVVRTAPIPLTVRPADRLSADQVVDFAGRAAPAARTLTEVSGGILANYTGMNEVLSEGAFAPGWGVWALLAAAPVVFGVCGLVQARRHRLRADPALARRRRARRAALRRLRRGEAAGLPAAVLGAVADYVADRCDLPAGSLTRAEVVRHLIERGAGAAVVEEVDRLLAACEQTQYAGLGGQEPRPLARAGQRCIGLLERERI